MWAEVSLVNAQFRSSIQEYVCFPLCTVYGDTVANKQPKQAIVCCGVDTILAFKFQCFFSSKLTH